MKSEFEKKALLVTLEMDLNMIEFKGEYAPDLIGSHIKIAGPPDSREAADYMHKYLDTMLPLLFANYFMNLVELKNDSLVTSGVKVACEMVLEYIESRSGGDK